MKSHLYYELISTSQFQDQSYVNRIQFERWKEWNPKDLEFEDNTHIIVYIGGSSDHLSYKGQHSTASYPGANTWRNVASGWWIPAIYWDDNVYGAGPLLHWYNILNSEDEPLDKYGLELLKDPEYLSGEGFFSENENTHYGWLKTKIFAGEPSNYPFVHTIKVYEMPTFKTDWRQLGGFGAYTHYDPGPWPIPKIDGGRE